MADFETILYDEPVERLARITLNRVEARNAQNKQMLYELNAAFSLQHLGHSHNQQLYGMPADPTGAEVIRAMNRPKAAS